LNSLAIHVKIRPIADHTNFLNPANTTGASIGSATFGRITAALDPRLVQLTLHYFF
jgi:hypothetical protein